MGTYSTQEWLDTFGGLPEPGETYADPDDVLDQHRDALEQRSEDIANAPSGFEGLIYEDPAKALGLDTEDDTCS